MTSSSLQDTRITNLLDSSFTWPDNSRGLQFNIPTGLVPLMALIKFSASIYRSAAGIRGVLDTLTETNPDLPNHCINSQRMRKKLADQLRDVNSEVAMKDFRMARVQVARAIRSLEKDTPEYWLPTVREAFSRVEDALSEVNLYIIAPALDSHYDNPLANWDNIPKQFTKTAPHIEAAERALALGLFTASAFHAMAIFNEGLMVLNRRLRAGVDPVVDDWGEIVKKINDASQNKLASFSRTKKARLRPYHEEATSDLRSVKNAFRNPMMHFTRTYEKHDAEKILGKVRDFMLHLASKSP